MRVRMRKRQAGGGRWRNVVGNVKRSRKPRQPTSVQTAAEPAKEHDGRRWKGRKRRREREEEI